jgi:hypothetical protein
LGAFDPGGRLFGMGLLRLGIGNGFNAVRFLALLGLSLFELSLGGQRVVADDRARDLLRLTLDRVEQPLTCLFGLFVLRHLSLLLTSIDTPQKELGGFQAVCAARPDGDGTSADQLAVASVLIRPSRRAGFWVCFTHGRPG